MGWGEPEWVAVRGRDGRLKIIQRASPNAADPHAQARCPDPTNRGPIQGSDDAQDDAQAFKSAKNQKHMGRPMICLKPGLQSMLFFNPMGIHSQKNH